MEHQWPYCFQRDCEVCSPATLTLGLSQDKADQDGSVQREMEPSQDGVHLVSQYDRWKLRELRHL